MLAAARQAADQLPLLARCLATHAGRHALSGKIEGVSHIIAVASGKARGPCQSRSLLRAAASRMEDMPLTGEQPFAPTLRCREGWARAPAAVRPLRRVLLD